MSDRSLAGRRSENRTHLPQVKDVRRPGSRERDVRELLPVDIAESQTRKRRHGDRMYSSNCRAECSKPGRSSNAADAMFFPDLTDELAMHVAINDGLQ